MITALEVNARRIKRSIPRSWFTKKGPGVEANARRFFQSLDAYDREVVLRKGWFPPAWANLPFKPEPKARPTPVAPPAPKNDKSPGFLGKMWRGLRRLFGGGQ